ncbi:class I SAM-dependent methyltransferase [Humibacter soli]
MSARPKGKYGIDAPAVPLGWGASTVACAVLAVVFAPVGSDWSIWLSAYFGVLALLSAVGTLLYLRASLVGKFEIWREVISALALRGDERALDLGCGHGTVSVLLAQQLPNGRVMGIDLWRSVDQSANSIEAATRNLVANGVDDRVGLETGDMTSLPYADASFDLVTASLAVHNLRTADARRGAILEALRVLRPGGRLVIVDIQRVRECTAVVRDRGLAVNESRDLGWRMWWTGPWFPTRLLIATAA